MLKHHEKEEEIFLPMASHLLLERRDEIMRKLKAFDSEKGQRDWGF
jgi:hypothetical protein